MAETNRDHWSASQIQMGIRCMEQYRRVYIEGERRAPGMAAFVGSGVHVGVAENYSQKIESHVDLPPSQTADAAVAGFDQRLLDDDIRTDTAEACDGRDQTAQLAMFAGSQVMPQHQPAMVEKRFELSVPGLKKKILGFIDMADVQGIVHDTKTAARKKTQREADHSIQLSIYHVAHRALTGEYPEKMVLDVILKKSPPEHQQVTTTRTPADLSALAHRIDTMAKTIDAGIFQGADPVNDWHCSQKFCGFWNDCPFVASYRKETK